jgi:UDP-2-acetamido-2,6-beta-L-arabino-hexul-4-ose reductase
MINGVKIKKLDIKSDDRGWFTEILRSDEVENPKLGQFYVTTATVGQTKGKHYHERKIEWFCVIKGKALLTLIENKTGEKQEIEMGEDNMVTVEIPAGVWHAIANTGQDEMFLVAHISESYNPEDPDTFKKEEYE